MFDKAKVITGLYGLVGLRQPTSTAYAILDAPNYGSRSGYYSTDNPFCKAEFLIDGIDDSAASDAQINTYIKQLQESSITEVCNQIFSDSDYIDRNFLYKNTFNLVATETVTAGFVGYQIIVSSKKNVAFEIPRILLNFNNAGIVKLQLFQSNVPDALFEKTIAFSSDNHIEDLGWVIDNTADSYKGSYYLGYFTSNLTKARPVSHVPMPFPYKRDYQNSIVKSEISELQIDNVFIPYITTEEIWDLSTNQLGNDNCFGLNPDITVFYDFTDLILRNEKIFSKAVDLSFQIKIINSYISSLRSNKNQRISADLVEKAMIELNGLVTSNSVLNKIGLIPSLRNEIVAVKKQIDKIKEGYFGNPNAPKLITLS
jgi:hypothetical protein